MDVKDPFASLIQHIEKRACKVLVTGTQATNRFRSLPGIQLLTPHEEEDSVCFLQDWLKRDDCCTADSHLDLVFLDTLNTSKELFAIKHLLGAGCVLAVGKQKPATSSTSPTSDNWCYTQGLMTRMGLEVMEENARFICWQIQQPLKTVVNLHVQNNGAGLTKDIQVLLQALASSTQADADDRHRHTDKDKGVVVQVMDVDQPRVTWLADVAFHLEHISLAMLSNARINVFIPNPDYFGAAPFVHDEHGLVFMDHILTKTRAAHESFAPAHQQRKTFVSFTSEDCLAARSANIGVLEEPSPLALAMGINQDRNWSTIVHLPGMSTRKQTNVVLETWRRFGAELPKLIIVSQLRREMDDSKGALPLPRNVTWIEERLSNEMVQQIQNQYGLHLCASDIEGFGHYINEARSVGACIITTDAAPMNELVDARSGVLVPPSSTRPFCAALLHQVSPGDLFQCIKHVTGKLSGQDREVLGSRARARYEHDRLHFLELFAGWWRAVELQLNSTALLAKWLSALHANQDAYVIRNHRRSPDAYSLLNLQLQVGSTVKNVVLPLHV